MKSKKQRKAVLRLPTNFKERVVQAELNLESDSNDAKVIQQLMTLYTLGKDYYGSIKNKVLHEYYKDKYLAILKKNKLSVPDEEIYDNYETRHSTEPSKSIIKINLQEKVFFLPRTHLLLNTNFDMNKTVSYNTNRLNTSVNFASPLKTISTARNRKSLKKMNKTFALDKISERGFSFFDMLNTSKHDRNGDKNFRITPNDLNVSTLPETTTARKGLNDTFVLRSNRSSDNILKKQVNERIIQKRKKENEEIVMKVREEIERMNYDSQKWNEVVDLEIERQRKIFEESKEKLDQANDKKEKKYLKRKGSLFDKVIKTMLENKSPNSVVKKIFEFAENKIIDEENLMHKEIEDFVMQNLSEMDNEIKLMEESYEDDISKFDEEDVYRDIIRKLKDELASEIKKINDKYDKARVEEIEKIKAKYLK